MQCRSSSIRASSVEPRLHRFTAVLGPPGCESFVITTRGLGGFGSEAGRSQGPRSAKSGHEQPSKAAAELGAIQLVDSLFPIS